MQIEKGPPDRTMRPERPQGETIAWKLIEIAI
jgi:hypothetical protein